MSLFWDVLGTLTGTGGTPAAEDIGTQAAGGTGVFGALTAFFATITDGKMWRSLGWLVLGLIIMGIGINLWLRNPVGRAVGAAGRAAVL